MIICAVYVSHVLTSSCPVGVSTGVGYACRRWTGGERDQHLQGNCAREITCSEKEDWLQGRWEKTKPEDCTYLTTTELTFTWARQIQPKLSPTNMPVKNQTKIITLNLNSDWMSQSVLSMDLFCRHLLTLMCFKGFRWNTKEVIYLSRRVMSGFMDFLFESHFVFCVLFSFVPHVPTFYLLPWIPIMLHTCFWLSLSFPCVFKPWV